VNDDAAPDGRIPRPALIVVAIGLLACVVAAGASTDKASGTAAELEWIQSKQLPDSPRKSVPGGSGEMRLLDAGILGTGTNASGYSLYRVAATLAIDAGSPVGGGRIVCSVSVPRGTEIAQTPELRATYPRSSENLVDQEVFEVSLLQFSSHGTDLAVVEMDDLFEDGFAGEEGIKLKWPTYEVGDERLEWFLPPHPPAERLVLPFATIWKTTKVPAADIVCGLMASGSFVSVRTSGALPDRSEPIDEEEEE
jgi:hypothetical protein